MDLCENNENYLRITYLKFFWSFFFNFLFYISFFLNGSPSGTPPIRVEGMVRFRSNFKSKKKKFNSN